MSINQIIGERRSGRTSALVDQGVHAVLSGKNVLVIAPSTNETMLLTRMIAEKLRYLARDTPDFEVNVASGNVYSRVPTPDFYALYGIKIPRPGIVYSATYSPVTNTVAQMRGNKIGVVLIDNADYLKPAKAETDPTENLKDFFFDIGLTLTPERVWIVSENPIDLSSDT